MRKISLFLLSLVFSFSVSYPAFGALCDKGLLPADYFTVKENGKIVFGAVRAGARGYPKDFALHNIGLTENEILSMQGRVLLIGEGFGNLLPIFARAREIELTSVDPIYGLNPIPQGFMGDSLREVLSRYSAVLDPSSSTALPIADASVDRIYSHLLINNFLEEVPGTDDLQLSSMASQTIIEAVRVLKPGGRAVFAVLMTRAEAKELLHKVKSEYPKNKVPFQYRTSAFKVRLDFKSFGNLAPDLQNIEPEVVDVTRFVITKLDKKK